MCDKGTTSVVSIQRVVSVDACLTDEIIMLNGRGVRTLSSCCGHGGVSPPSILIHAGDATQARMLGYDPTRFHSNTMQIVPRG